MSQMPWAADRLYEVVPAYRGAAQRCAGVNDLGAPTPWWSDTIRDDNRKEAP